MVNDSNMDALWLSKLRQGKTEVFSQVYQTYVERIYRFVFFKLATREDAEDITSQTFFQALNYLVRPDAQVENLSAFLYRVARNQVADFYRARGSYVSDLEIGELSDTLADTGLDLSLDFDRQLDLETVKLALKNLNPSYQDAIIWYFVEEQSIAEISQILEKNQGTVRVLIFRAIKSLKEELTKNVK